MSDDFDFNELAGKSKEEAFVIYQEKVYSIYIRHKSNENSDYATGEPEHDYTNSMFPFLEEYNIMSDITDFSSLQGKEFHEEFRIFLNRMQRLSRQFQLRKNLYGIGTLIYIATNYKEEISNNLTLIEKIVNQADIDTYKKDNIHKQITNLRNVINSENTNLEHFILGCHKVTKAVGEVGRHIKPLMDQIEKLKDFFWKCSDFIPLLPKQTEPRKKIEYVEKTVALEDDIPF